jgi:hypothetical protein
MENKPNTFFTKLAVAIPTLREKLPSTKDLKVGDETELPFEGFIVIFMVKEINGHKQWFFKQRKEKKL